MRMLTEDDREMLCQLLDPNCQSLSVALTQVWECETQRKRIEKFTGGLCFYKDNNNKGYFQTLYCLKTKHLLWKKQISKDTVYIKRKIFIHAIKSKDQNMVVYHFAERKEADDMLELVQKVIEDLKQHKEDFRTNCSNEIDDFFQKIGIARSDHPEDDTRELVFSWMNELQIKEHPSIEADIKNTVTNSSSSTSNSEELPINHKGSLISQRRQQILEQLRKAGVQ